MTDKLLPCPFCSDPMQDRGYGAAHINGKGCPIGDLAVDVEKWNRRATPLTSDHAFAEGHVIERLEIRPGDRFVIRADYPLSRETAGKIHAAFKRFAGHDAQVFIMDRGSSLSVLSEQHPLPVDRMELASAPASATFATSNEVRTNGHSSSQLSNTAAKPAADGDRRSEGAGPSGAACGHSGPVLRGRAGTDDRSGYPDFGHRPEGVSLRAPVSDVKPIRWLVKNELPGGSTAWVVVEHEDNARRRAATMMQAGAINVVVVPLYSAPPAVGMELPAHVRDFLGKVQGVCMGVAMSGRDHPNPDGALMELFEEAQAILFPEQKP